jgi:hypothetical protein
LEQGAPLPAQRGTMGTRIYSAFSIYFTSSLSDGVAASPSAAKRQKSMIERTAGSDLAVRGGERDKADSLVS